MKVMRVVAGFVVGIIIGLWLSMLLFGRKSLSKSAPAYDGDPTTSVWHWPDSLDAVVAARKNHELIFENDAVRILEVKLGPYENEPMHTHRLPSYMFGRGSNDTAAFDIVYYRYDYDPVGRRYFIKDSFPQHRAATQPGVADTGHYMKPEQPHGIRNLSNVTIDVYRVEFKGNGKHP
jgi:hypothetical protein